MVVQKSNRRTDDQLLAVLDETAEWHIAGSIGQTLASASSLRRALQRVEEFSLSGAIVVAIRKPPFDSVIVFPGQIDDLTKALASEFV